MTLADIFSVVLNMSLAANIVILTVYLARLVLQRAPKIYSYLLWALVLFRLLCPVSITSSFSLIPERIGSGEIITEWEDDYIGETHTYFDNRTEYETAVEAGRETIPAGENHFYVVTGSDGISKPKTVENAILPMLATAWLGGMVVLGFYSSVSYIRIRKQTRAAIPFRKNIYLADQVTSPFVMGLFHPAIYLPSTLDDSERCYIIAHERHHIYRGDHIFKALGFLALTIHWFNPLVWLAFSLASCDMEMSCDEAVIRLLGEDIRADYSATLLNLATGRRLFVGSPLAFGEDHPTDRVRNLAKWKKPAIWVIIICILVCAVLAVCLLTDPAQETIIHEDDNNITATKSDQIATNPVQEDSDPAALCKQAIENLKNAESYYIVMEYESSGTTGKEEYFRLGMDFLRRGTNALQGDAIFFNGNYSFQKGTEWNHSSGADVFDPNDWLQLWSPEGKTISNLQVNENRISFDAVWPATGPGYDSCDGTFTYEFDEAGSLVSVTKEYAMFHQNEVAVRTKEQLTPTAHDPQQVYETIRTAAGQYGLHYDDLGISISAQRVSRTGADVLFAAKALEKGTEISDITYGDFLSLERLENDKWVAVKELPGYEYYVGDASYPVADGYGMVHEWQDRFGELPDGHYRLGKLVTVHYTNGTSEQSMFYTEFFLPDSILTGLNPLEDLPEKYSAEQAMLDGCFVQADGIARENKELFHQFAVVTQKRVPSSIRIVNWYYGVDPHYDAFDLSYDGSLYTISWIADGQHHSRQFRYLMHFAGEKERNNMAYDRYEHYVLLNDNTINWNDIWGNLISSATPTPIDHMTVYSDYTYLSKKPQIPTNLAQAVLEFEGETLVNTTDFDRLEKLCILFSDAEFLGCEPKTHSIGVDLNLILTTRDGKSITIELDPDSDLCRIDGEYVFYGAYDEPDYIEKLWYYLDIESWPDAVYDRCPNAFKLQEIG